MPGGIGVSEEAEEAGLKTWTVFPVHFLRERQNRQIPLLLLRSGTQAASIKSKTRTLQCLKTLFIAATSLIDKESILKAVVPSDHQCDR